MGEAWSNQLITLLILTLPGGFNGIFGYSPSPGPGNLVISITNQAGTDPYGNPYPAGVSVGSASGPQVQLTGGNPAYIQWPLNDAGFPINPSIFSNVIGAGVTRFAQVVWNGAALSSGTHDDQVIVGLNSPNANGSSSANGELDYVDASGVIHYYMVWDRGGIGIRVCQELTAADPSVTATSTSPAIPETWHDMRPLSNSFNGTIAGYLPPQYRKVSDGTIQIAGYVQLPAALGNYNNVAFDNLPAAYRPPNLGGAGRPQWCATDAPAAGATPVKVIVKENGDMVLVGMNASLSGTNIGIFGQYALSNTGQILS